MSTYADLIVDSLLEGGVENTFPGTEQMKLEIIDRLNSVGINAELTDFKRIRDTEILAMYYRFVDGLHYKDISQKMGFKSRMRSTQLVNMGVGKLRDNMKKEDAGIGDLQSLSVAKTIRESYAGFQADELNSNQPIPADARSIYRGMSQHGTERLAKLMRRKYGINVWVDGTVTTGWRVLVHAGDVGRASRMIKSV